MAIKDSNQLLLDTNNNISSQVAPESITPPILGNLLADMIDSFWNKVDGITCTLAAIPATFTGIIHDGDPLDDIIFNLMDRIDAINTLVSGGVQGRTGQFLANVTSSTMQIFPANQSFTTTGTYYDAGGLKLVNDKDNGSFDNGNNWEISEYIASSPYNGIFTVSGFSMKVLSALSGGGNTEFQLAIQKNGVDLVTSPTTIIFDAGNSVGDIDFIQDFNTAILALVAGDKIRALIRYRNNISGGSSGLLQIVSGTFNN